MLDLTVAPRIHPQVAARILDGRAIIVLADVGEVLVLNPSGAQIWQQMDGRRTVGEMAAGLARNYRLDTARAEQDVMAFMATLLDVQAIAVTR